MSESAIERLENDSKVAPNVPTLVYPGDVMEEVNALRQRVAELAGRQAELIDIASTSFDLHQQEERKNAALREQVARMKAALAEVHEYNPLHNDTEAYLYELERWGLGEVEERPKPESYGLRALADTAAAGEGK